MVFGQVAGVGMVVYTFMYGGSSGCCLLTVLSLLVGDLEVFLE